MIRNSLSLILMLFGLNLFFSAKVYAQSKEYVISGQQIFLRDRPSFLGKVIVQAQYGQKVQLSKKTNTGWFLVKMGDKTGWVFKSAVQDSYYILKEIGKGKEAASKSVYKDEVVAAGKGFSPEYEAMMKSQNPNLNYKSVDEMEKWNIGVDKLAGFGTKGGLTSEVLK
ncbi:MAG: SH3 domain-containing protein [Pseudobdellovibrio sp.]